MKYPLYSSSLSKEWTTPIYLFKPRFKGENMVTNLMDQPVAICELVMKRGFINEEKKCQMPYR